MPEIDEQDNLLAQMVVEKETHDYLMSEVRKLTQVNYYLERKKESKENRKIQQLQSELLELHLLDKVNYFNSLFSSKKC